MSQRKFDSKKQRWCCEQNDRWFSNTIISMKIKLRVVNEIYFSLYFLLYLLHVVLQFPLVAKISVITEEMLTIQILFKYIIQYILFTYRWNYLKYCKIFEDRIVWECRNVTRRQPLMTRLWHLEIVLSPCRNTSSAKVASQGARSTSRQYSVKFEEVNWLRCISREEGAKLG